MTLLEQRDLNASSAKILEKRSAENIRRIFKHVEKLATFDFQLELYEMC